MNLNNKIFNKLNRAMESQNVTDSTLTNSTLTNSTSTNNSEASLEVILGPMYAGKSTELLRRVRRYKLSGNKILIVSNDIDTRSGSYIRTHDGVEYTGVRVSQLSDIFEMEDYETYDIICFDEAQFFSDLIQSVQKLLKDNKRILCAGLSGTFKRTPFDNISDLISLATNITFLKSICTFTHDPTTRTSTTRTVCGKDAPYTKKISGTNNNEIQIGDMETYCPRCLEHYDV